MSDKPHRRRNLLTGEWVLVSPHRAARPWQGAVEAIDEEPLPHHDPDCYLCPGNVRTSGTHNPDYADTFVFQNDFPALLDEGGTASDDPLFQSAPATGEARVICYSPDHAATFATLSPKAARQVIETWCAQSAELGQRWAHVQIFENKGAAMGCSSPHPHGQIWASNFVPTLVAREDAEQRARPALLADYAEAELRADERVVAANDHWLVVVPWWASWPFETLVIARDPVARLEDLGDDARTALAGILLDLTRRYDALFATSFPYSMGWHGAPHSHGDDTAHWRLHAHFYPPLLRSATVRKFMVGYELLAETQRDLTPEQAADPAARAVSDLDTRLRMGFAQHFGGESAHIAGAPGRVNLIGEHTDYNDGFALPAAVAEQTRVAIRPRADRTINAVALDFGASDSFDLAAIDKTGGWADYLRGVVVELVRAGHAIGGADIAIAGNIPKGTGLSSSASLEIALIRAFFALVGEPFDPVPAALIGQRAENDFVGMRCGNLDQLAAAAARTDAAVLIDCRSLELTQVPLPDDCAIVIVQSGVERGLVEGHYNRRRVECETAAQMLGVPALRDATMAMLDAATMPETIRRRARHVITENARTLAAAEALSAADYVMLGRLMVESHASMRDDFEITVPATDRLAAAMTKACGGVGGARQTGGGFGGAVVAVTDKAHAAAVVAIQPD